MNTIVGCLLFIQNQPHQNHSLAGERLKKGSKRAVRMRPKPCNHKVQIQQEAKSTHQELYLKIPTGGLKFIDQRLPDILCKFLSWKGGFERRNEGQGDRELGWEGKEVNSEVQ